MPERSNAAGNREILDAAVHRRLTGEPLAWITGRVSFCGLKIHVDPDVYVPRWLSEPLAQRAAERLPATGQQSTCAPAAARSPWCCGRNGPARGSWRLTSMPAPSRAQPRTASTSLGDLFAPLPDGLEGRSTSSSASCRTFRRRAAAAPARHFHVRATALLRRWRGRRRHPPPSISSMRGGSSSAAARCFLRSAAIRPISSTATSNASATST